MLSPQLFTLVDRVFTQGIAWNMNRLIQPMSHLRLYRTSVPSNVLWPASSVTSFKINDEPVQLSVSMESRRFGRRYRKWHHWPNDFLPFQWERPKLDPPHFRTGDSIRDVGVWDPKALVPGAELSKELENAPECVRRQFTLEFARRDQIVEHQRNKILSRVRRFKFDVNSPEVQIAKFTIYLRNNMFHFSKVDPNAAERKISQSGFINKRNVLLKHLYYQDRERYDNIIKTLGITHIVPKLGEPYRKPTRKGELRRLTQEYVDNIKEQKLENYHQELKSKQATLKDEIAKIEQLVASDDKYLGISNENSSI